MRRPGRLALIAMVAATTCAAGTLAARADWNVAAVGELTARTATIPKGGTPSVEKVGATAVVRWNAQEIGPGTTMDRYVVTAHSVGKTPLPAVTRTVVATGDAVESITFAAGEVDGGAWYWTVVPRFRLWTGAESGHSRRLDFPAAPASRRKAAAPTVAPVTAPTTAPAAADKPTPATTSSSAAPPATVEPSDTAPAPVPALPAGGASVPGGAAG